MGATSPEAMFDATYGVTPAEVEAERAEWRAEQAARRAMRD